MSSDNSFDLVVIGSGPAGYVAAIRGAQLGLKTALIEKSPNLGGTCLNVGCIPSKALLHSTEMYHFIEEKGKKHGIKTKGLSADIPALMKHKDDTVSKLRMGVEQLVSKRKIKIFKGHGKLKSATTIEVTGESNSVLVEAKNTIIATGSTSVELPFLPFDGNGIISSDHAIALKEVPKKLVVVGAGAIGLELGSVWRRLGSEVTVVELLPNIAPTFDTDISKLAQKIFTKQGMKFELNTKVTGSKKVKGKLYLTAEKDGKELEYEADKILVSVGRKPFTGNLGLEEIGIKTERGRILVDSHLRTNIPNIYAVGDVTTGPMLAHKAEEEGVAAAELIAGKAGHVNYNVIPNVVYTEPEIASVGISENEAKEKSINVNVGKFNLAANGRALACDVAEGMVKVIACAQTDKVLGIQMIGHGVSEIIASAVAHMEYGGSAEDIARTIHAHPTVSESLKEAALAVDKRAIHSL